jgi:hypothetical protein
LYNAEKSSAGSSGLADFCIFRANNLPQIAFYSIIKYQDMQSINHEWNPCRSDLIIEDKNISLTLRKGVVPNAVERYA